MSTDLLNFEHPSVLLFCFIPGLRIRFEVDSDLDEGLAASKILQFGTFLKSNYNANLKIALSGNDFWKGLTLESVKSSTKDVTLGFMVYSTEQSRTAIANCDELEDILGKLADCQKYRFKFNVAETTETWNSKYSHGEPKDSTKRYELLKQDRKRKNGQRSYFKKKKNLICANLIASCPRKIPFCPYCSYYYIENTYCALCWMLKIDKMLYDLFYGRRVLFALMQLKEEDEIQL